ncbi:F-box/FBD/LRR-repeat protein [Camellia lanceoleosa]|uniref:F-box/FBD/LRR-repeat protein n=1 Tax=Camellia lanceoleosa TaxID=1840588 RepID=A0ACC0IAU3_9ERIC|nr:F-box/FBD/LRR-repeat protein [Camellia lanceoleosa]
MLVRLHFVNVVIAHEMFGNFISNCPLLQRLILASCNISDCLEINAPTLKYFLLHGIFKSICFSRTPLLAEISVSLCSLDANSKQHEGREDSNFVKFFHCLPAIENLTLDKQILEFLAVGGVPKSLPSTMNRLKILNLFQVSFHKIDQVSCVLFLIRSSPNLQKLEIRYFTNTLNPVNLEAVTKLLQAQDLSKFPLSRLRKVKMLLLRVEPEMEFVKLLLACSTALKKMEILHEPGSCEKAFEVLKKLTRFPRASPLAELIFLN